MREIKVFFIIIVIFLSVWVFTQNSTGVDINIFGQIFTGIPIYMLALVSMAMGVIIGFGFLLAQNLKLRSVIKLLEKERNKLEFEQNKRRSSVLNEDTN
jgi:uncharacterized integral membrane protein